MKNLLAWIQTNKLTAVLLVVLFFVGVQFFSDFQNTRVMNSFAPSGGGSISNMAMGGPVAMDVAVPAVRSKIFPPTPSYGESTNLNVADRKVVTDTNFSLLVENVVESIQKLKTRAEEAGGFMVSSSVNRPEEGGNGTLIVRVPSDQLDAYLEEVRGASVRVVSENVMGNDVTDQYTDIEARLATLNQTKQIYQDMLSRATDVDEILRVQQSIFSVQDQIDSLQGQLQYLSNTTQSSLVTIYLSTDELSLPYAPGEPWRPQVVFKTAVRSLMMNLRGAADLVIWAVVYSPVLLVGLIIVLLLRRSMKKS